MMKFCNIVGYFSLIWNRYLKTMQILILGKQWEPIHLVVHHCYHPIPFSHERLLKTVMLLSCSQDMDLIEVLWKQDVDLGFSLDLFNPSKPEGEGKAVRVEDDDVEKLKALEALKNETPTDTTKVSGRLQNV
jgi:hypothetical protein